MLGRIPASCLSLVAACYSPPKPDCGFVCGPGGACPESYYCAGDNHCHLEGTPQDLACAADAAIDVVPIDVPIPPDMTPPRVLSTMPPSNATNINVGATISVQFTEDVTGVDVQSFQVDSSGPVAGSIMPMNPQVWVFVPDMAYAAGATVNVSITTAIIDLAGNPLEAPYAFSFQTAP